MAVSEPHIILVGGDGGPSGVPRHMMHLAYALASEANVTLVSDTNTGGFDGAADAGAAHVTLPALQTRKSIGHLWRGWRGLLGYLRETSADLVWLHARLPVLIGRLALALRLWRPKRRVAVTFHGLPFGEGHKPMNSRISIALEKVLLRTCPPLDLVFLSKPMADRLGAAMGDRRMHKHRVHVLPNCSDLGTLTERLQPEGTHLVMTGRAGWQKNYELAARLFAHMPEHYHLTLSGFGTDDAAFQDSIKTLIPSQAIPRLHFAGPLRDVRPVLMAADGYLLCSRYEGLPIGTLEAFEAGLPAILSRFDGAEALAATSPHTLVLNFKDLRADAGEIDALLATYKANRDTARAEIRAQWQTHWSPAVFHENSRALLGKLLD